jgi:hypothetical protein
MNAVFMFVSVRSSSKNTLTVRTGKSRKFAMDGNYMFRKGPHTTICPVTHETFPLFRVIVSPHMACQILLFHYNMTNFTLHIFIIPESKETFVLLCRINFFLTKLAQTIRLYFSFKNFSGNLCSRISAFFTFTQDFRIIHIYGEILLIRRGGLGPRPHIRLRNPLNPL